MEESYLFIPSFYSLLESFAQARAFQPTISEHHSIGTSHESENQKINILIL